MKDIIIYLIDTVNQGFSSRLFSIAMQKKLVKLKILFLNYLINFFLWLHLFSASNAVCHNKKVKNLCKCFNDK